jgi:WS/DGAT/MGAT family acyltransferase
VPRLRQRLVRASFGCGRPIWVDDARFDIRHHIRAVRCPPPGNELALLEVAADFATRRLTPSRPLWAATVVTGLADGGAALIVVLHHVLADGIGGLAILARLVDGSHPAPTTEFPRPPPRRGDLFIDVLNSRSRAVSQLPGGLRQLRAAVTELAPRGGRRQPSSLNRPSMGRRTGPRRSLAVASVDLESVQRLAHLQGATVNDVVLTAVTGALRETLHHRGETADEFVVSVPVSARRVASVTELGNEVGAIPIALPSTGEPLQRLASIAAITRARKTANPGASAALLGPGFRTLAKLGALRWFVDRQRVITTFVTNVHGPDTRLWFLGAPIARVIPVSPIVGNVTVAFAVLSYAGTLTVTIIADPSHCPDLQLLVAALQRELHRMTGDLLKGTARFNPVQPAGDRGLAAP